MYKKYVECTNCDYYETALGDHNNIFRHVCPECGKTKWSYPFIAEEIFIGKWYKPLTWGNYELKKQ